ncbi:MAG: hypothetical protein WB791_07770, partial [Waddliaceae bacterium]
FSLLNLLRFLEIAQGYSLRSSSKSGEKMSKNPLLRRIHSHVNKRWDFNVSRIILQESGEKNIGKKSYTCL